MLWKTQIAEPYEISLGTVPEPPLVGPVHFSVKLVDSANNIPISNATLNITGTGPGDNRPSVRSTEISNNPLDPDYYDTRMVLDRAGKWTFTVSVSHKIGSASAKFPLDVKNPNPVIGIATLVVFISLLGIIGFSSRMHLKKRKSPTKSSIE